MSRTNENANLAIWESVSKTDPDYTKGYKGSGGFTGTAINATYLTRRATELWGPLGIGWGYEVMEERIDQGAPIANKDSDGNPYLTEHFHTIHTIKLKLWFKQGDERGEVIHYGHTPMVYVNKYGIQTELEPAKKSLTDALKKCLSMLGFSADIFLGDYEDADYLSQVRAEMEIEKAEDREATTEAQRGELTDYVKRHIDSIKSAQTPHEVNGIAKSALRYLERRKAIPEMADIAEKGIKAISRDAQSRKEEVEQKQ